MVRAIVAPADALRALFGRPIRVISRSAMPRQLTEFFAAPLCERSSIESGLPGFEIEVDAIMQRA